MALLRNAACAGCPVGCIHIGFVRERFRKEHRYLYRQVSYDHEPIFAVGAMLSVENCFAVLAIIDVAEKMGLDVMSAGVALAWATEATEKGIISEKETIVRLSFGDSEGYKQAMQHLGKGTNEFYRLLAQGTLKAAEHYGGKDYACVLGQEMAGYATGEVFFASQALGLRHSHLDSGGYSYDQKEKGKDPEGSRFSGQGRTGEGASHLHGRLSLCPRRLYGRAARNVPEGGGLYSLQTILGLLPGTFSSSAGRTRLATGFVPEEVTIPKRFLEITTVKGPLDSAFLASLMVEYGKAIRALGQ